MLNSDHWWGGSGHQWDYLESQRTSRRAFEVLGGCVKVFGGDSMEVIGESMLSDHFGMSGCWWHHREGWVDITENKGWGLSLRIWELLASNGRFWEGNWEEDMGDQWMSIREWRNMSSLGFYGKIVEVRVVIGESMDIDWNKWEGCQGNQ